MSRKCSIELDGYEKSTPNKIGGYMLKDEEVQIEGTTTNKVQVIYSNKVEGEV